MSQREFGAQWRVALNEGCGKQVTENLLKGLPINPVSLVVVTLAQRKSEQAHSIATRQSRIRGRMVKWCLLVAGVVFWAALKERFTQQSQCDCR